jgi:glycine/D-amino acid oxidase-like deaminating enzyme
MGYSSDMMPHVGEVPGSPGQYVCAGFSGHGMAQIFGASRGLAKMILEGLSFEQTGLPLLFKTTQARLESGENLMENSLKAIWEQPKARL